MRIAFITHEFPPDTGKGGIGTYTVQISNLMASMGNVVHVFAGSDTRSCTEQEGTVWIHRVQCANGTDFRKKVLAAFEEHHQQSPFDIIESAEINGNALEIKNAFPNLPMVVRLHGPNWLVEYLKQKYMKVGAKLRFVLGALRRGRWDAGYWSKYDYLNDPDYQFCLLADAISAPSDAMKNWAVKNWKIPVQKIQVIPNPFIAPAALLELPIQKKAIHKQIVFFGRLNVLKGLVNATLAMKKILKEFPGYSFKVIGDDGRGPHSGVNMRSWMKKQLKRVLERVTFVDGLPYEQLPAAIADAEIALLPSLFESFSYTCAEAMAAGKAVIGSELTGMQDLIVPGNSGVLVRAESKKEIYHSIKKLIETDHLRYNLATNARESIREKYSASGLSREFLDYYKSVSGK